MASLTPVDQDPFSAAPGTALTPVDHDPFAKPPPPAGPGADPLLTQQSDEGWGSFFLRHVHAASRAIDDLASLGFADKGQGALDQAIGAGPTTAQLRADTNAAYATNPAIVNAGLGAATYAMGPGELAAASKIGRAVAPTIGKWAGGVLGSGLEGAGAGALGAAGHDEDIFQGAKWGGLFGLAGGVPGGVVGRGGTLAPALDEAALRARATQEYAPLDAMVFHGPNQVKPALDAVTNTMTQAEQDLAKSTMAKVNKLADTNLATGSDIQSYQKIFGGLAKTGSDMDKEFAPKFERALENVMQSAPYGRNVTPGQGMSLMPAGSLGGTGFAPGAAAAARDAGDVFHGRAEDIRRLNIWQDKANVTGGPDVGSQASSYLTSPTGQRFAPPPAAGALPATAPAYSAINNVAGTAAKESSIPWWVKHFVIAPAAGTIANEGFQAFSGEHESPSEHLLADLGIGGTLALSTMGYSAATRASARAAQQRAMDAARSTLSTGNYQAPLDAVAPFREAVRKLIFGQGAAGRLPGQ
jgi:hypothetical protein